MSLKKALESVGERFPHQLPPPELIDLVASADDNDNASFDSPAARPLVLDEGDINLQSILNLVIFLVRRKYVTNLSRTPKLSNIYQ